MKLSAIMPALMLLTPQRVKAWLERPEQADLEEHQCLSLPEHEARAAGAGRRHPGENFIRNQGIKLG